MLVNVFNEKITMFENIPPLRKEVVHGMEIILPGCCSLKG